jgi:hypothetical protein
VPGASCGDDVRVDPGGPAACCVRVVGRVGARGAGLGEIELGPAPPGRERGTGPIGWTGRRRDDHRRHRCGRPLCGARARAGSLSRHAELGRFHGCRRRSAGDRAVAGTPFRASGLRRGRGGSGNGDLSLRQRSSR